MTKHLITPLLAALLAAATHLPAQAQAPAQPARYADRVGNNPTADADIRVVNDWLNALTVEGNPAKARALMAEGYQGHGPSAADSTTRDQTLAGWQGIYKTQLNRRLRYLGQTTFQMKTGPMQGNWVATWGEYSCTLNGTPVRIPFQTTDRVTNGKVDWEYTYNDNLSVRLKLGYKLTPPAAAAAPAAAPAAR